VVLLLGVLWCGVARGAEEPPPAQGTRLHFEKTLSVQRTGSGKVFAETRQVAPGESLWQILSDQYGIKEADMPLLLQAFRAVNPGVDPDRLNPGQVVRVPFKVEEDLSGSAAAAQGPQSYTVQSGDSLWKVLRSRFHVARERMTEALEAVARANPKIRDLNRLYVGQTVVIPGLPGDQTALTTSAPAALPTSYRTTLDLLRELRCQTQEEGETFLPLSRGRTVRLDARDFPILTGPAGARVILDPRARLSAALARAVGDEWGYHCVSGTTEDPLTYLERILPFLGFHELGEGERTIALGGGAELVALARWVVIPRARDLWEGKLHLIFAPGSILAPGLVDTAARAGFAVHVLGPSATPDGPVDSPPPLVELPMSDRAAGTARLLGLLGVPHQLHPQVDCDLGGGIRYTITPELTFRAGGLDYAVPPASPARAEALLTRAGFFTLPWAPAAVPMNVLADVLSLLGVRHAVTSVEVPPGHALRLRARGIVVEDSRLAGVLYPSARPGRLFLTEANLPGKTAAALMDQGLLPWLVR
jgi:LysM repeat protein